MDFPHRNYEQIDIHDTQISFGGAQFAQCLICTWTSQTSRDITFDEDTNTDKSDSKEPQLSWPFRQDACFAEVVVFTRFEIYKTFLW